MPPLFLINIEEKRPPYFKVEIGLDKSIKYEAAILNKRKGTQA